MPIKSFIRKEPSNRINCTAFRIYYADGEILEGLRTYEWQRAPIKDVDAVEFFYDEWNGAETKRTLHTNQGGYFHPDLPNQAEKPGTNTPKSLKTKLETKWEKPRSISPATKEDNLHEMPLETMKGS